MTDQICEARAQDTNTVKYRILTYLPVDPNVESINPPITGREKSKRGWTHPWTARALCPLRYIDEFDKNPACAVLFFHSYYYWHAYKPFYEECQQWHDKVDDQGPSFILISSRHRLRQIPQGQGPVPRASCRSRKYIPMPFYLFLTPHHFPGATTHIYGRIIRINRSSRCIKTFAIWNSWHALSYTTNCSVYRLSGSLFPYHLLLILRG